MNAVNNCTLRNGMEGAAVNVNRTACTSGTRADSASARLGIFGSEVEVAAVDIKRAVADRCASRAVLSAGEATARNLAVTVVDVNASIRAGGTVSTAVDLNRAVGIDRNGIRLGSGQRAVFDNYRGSVCRRLTGLHLYAGISVGGNGGFGDRSGAVKIKVNTITLVACTRIDGAFVDVHSVVTLALYAVTLRRDDSASVKVNVPICFDGNADAGCSVDLNIVHIESRNRLGSCLNGADVALDLEVVDGDVSARSGEGHGLAAEERESVAVNSQRTAGNGEIFGKSDIILERNDGARLYSLNKLSLV